MENFLIEFLRKEGVKDKLVDDVIKFRKYYKIEENLKDRVPEIRYKYYGTNVWNKAISALLEGYHLLLSGPKATGKNVLSENLALLFNRPLWTISLNVSSDSSMLIGSDTFKDGEVTLKKGPVYEAAINGGIAVFDEINMAKNESLSVVHSALDYRRIIDVPGYEKINLHEATRFIATMNYGYIGTRELNEALLSRFLIIDMPVIEIEDFKKILKEEAPLKEEYVELFAQFFTDLQNKSLNSEISSKSIDLRGLFSSINLMRRGLPIREALDMGIVDKSFDKYEKEIVGDIIDTLFSKSLSSEDIFKDE